MRLHFQARIKLFRVRHILFGRTACTLISPKAVLHSDVDSHTDGDLLHLAQFVHVDPKWRGSYPNRHQWLGIIRTLSVHLKMSTVVISL